MIRYAKLGTGLTVNLNRGLREGGVNRFRTTQWDVVLLSAQSQSGIKLGVPNGTYVFNITGLVPPTPGATTLVPLAAVGRVTYFANGTTSGVTSFSIDGQLQTEVTFAGTFTVNTDGSVSETDKQTCGPGLLLHFSLYPTPDGNTLTIVQTDPGTIASGVDTRGR